MVWSSGVESLPVSSSSLVEASRYDFRCERGREDRPFSGRRERVAAGMFGDQRKPGAKLVGRQSMYSGQAPVQEKRQEEFDGWC